MKTKIALILSFAALTACQETLPIATEEALEVGILEVKYHTQDSLTLLSRFRLVGTSAYTADHHYAVLVTDRSPIDLSKPWAYTQGEMCQGGACRPARLALWMPESGPLKGVPGAEK